MRKTKGELLEYAAKMSAQNVACSAIDPALYETYAVKRGLRDKNGVGVLAGLTTISNVKAYEETPEGRKPCAGELRYRGINVTELVRGCIQEQRFGFEEAAYLLLFGRLPDRAQLEEFCDVLSALRVLPRNFVRDVIMKAPSKDIMNSLTRSVLTLSAYDSNPTEMTQENVLRQCLALISRFPMLAVYGYQVFRHYHEDGSLIIHKPDTAMSTSESILHMLRPDGEYSQLEAKLLDLCLVLHAEHGGGNNSTFTDHVVTSSGTDTYSAIAASLGSLKGPRHGGANVKVIRMMQNIRENVNPNDDDSIRRYLNDILDKKAFDKSGLIYGMGHAVYSISDPRAKILKSFIKPLAIEKGLEEEYRFYSKIEKIAPQVISERRRIYKGVSANIDFYSGLIYSMLGIPVELFTPIFAIARMSGWSAHRIEELSNNGKIIRPAYDSVAEHQPYVRLVDRK